LLDELVRTQATVLYAAPYHYGLLVHCREARPCPSLRLAVSTAAALPEATAEMFFQRFGLPLTQGFGIIEAGLPVLNRRLARLCPTAVGHPQPGFDLKIDAPDAEGIGEVLLRGPGMFDAYLQPWQPRDEVLDHGWFRTGDLGSLDESGCLTLRGRLKSVINVAGLKCFPEEIEAVLNAHPLVKESRVFARPHVETGSIPSAEIVPASPEQAVAAPALISHCRQHLAAYKIPLRYEFVAAVARTASGKILRTS
jgi:long-chain acyl-CoA synthetase